jgi:hypothetical protein
MKDIVVAEKIVGPDDVLREADGLIMLKDYIAIIEAKASADEAAISQLKDICDAFTAIFEMPVQGYLAKCAI